MRLTGLLFLAIVSLSLDACSQQQAASADKINDENDWSGSASYISRSELSLSSNEKYVAMESESFSEYRMDATLSRGFGQSSSSATIKERYKHTDKTGGRSSVSEKITTGNASGSMSTEIVVELTDDGKSYSFFIPVPAWSGERTTTISGGSAEVSEMGQDEGLQWAIVGNLEWGFQRTCPGIMFFSLVNMYEMGAARQTLLLHLLC